MDVAKWLSLAFLRNFESIITLQCDVLETNLNYYLVWYMEQMVGVDVSLIEYLKEECIFSAAHQFSTLSNRFLIHYKRAGHQLVIAT